MIYLFEHPKTGEVKEIYQSINDKHEYSEGGVQYKRVFTTSQLSNNTQVDPYSMKEFTGKSRDKNYTYGEMIDRSGELSEKRASKDGKDKLKEEYFKNYSKRRRGIKHVDDPSGHGGRIL